MTVALPPEDIDLGFLTDRKRTCDLARELTGMLEGIHRARGLSAADARQLASRRSDIPAGTLERLSKRRLKTVPVDIFFRLVLALRIEADREVRGADRFTAASIQLMRQALRPNA